MQLNDKKKRSFWEKLLICLGSAILFFGFSMPFRKMLSVFTVSEVRFAAVLNPLLGTCFGVPAAIGIMIANFIADYFSGYSTAVLLEGLPAQFLYTFVAYFIWNRLNRSEEHIHRLDSVKKMLRYIAAVLAYAVLSAVGVGLIVQLNFGADFLNCAFFVFLNNWIMGVVLGCPLMILMNRLFGTRDRKLSSNERMILIAGAIEIVLIAVIVIGVYLTSTSTVVYEIWNRIFILSEIVINIFMVIMLLVMVQIEKNTKDQ